MTDQLTGPNGEALSQKDQEALAAAGGMFGTEDITGQPPQGAQQPVAENKPAPTEDPKGQQNQPAQQQPGAGSGQPKPAAQPLQVQTAFGTEQFGQQAGPVLSSFEDVQAFAKEQGVELKSVDDIRGLFNTISELKAQAEAVPALTSTVNNYKTQLSSLPPEVANIVDAALASQDYRSLIKDIASGVDLDLTRNFSDHPALNMVRQYVDPSMTQEAFDELTDANKNAVLKLAQTSYETAKVNHQNAVASKAKEKQDYQAAFDASVESAVANLKQRFPSMNDQAISKVRQVMSSGLRESLFTENNTWKPEAGVKIAMQEFGEEALSAQKQTIGDLYQKISGQIQSETHEQLLQRSAQPDLQGRQAVNTDDQVAKYVDQATSFLN